MLAAQNAAEAERMARRLATMQRGCCSARTHEGRRQDSAHKQDACGGDHPAEHQKLGGVGKQTGNRRVDQGGNQQRDDAKHARHRQNDPDPPCHAGLTKHQLQGLHLLAQKLVQSPRVTAVFCGAPGLIYLKMRRCAGCDVTGPRGFGPIARNLRDRNRNEFTS